MTEGVKKANSPSSKENETSSGGNSKKKAKGEKFPTKVVVRKLPPSMNLDTFLENVSPLPDYDYINFVPADNSLFPFNFSRAYINFVNQEDLLIFTQKFDNYVFVDLKGHEFPALVEFAPFQRIPKTKANKKKDSKCNTIEDDPDYVKFKDRLQAEEEESESGKHNVFETTLPEDVPEKNTSTPLLDFLRKKREEKKRIREEKKEERKKRDLERRKLKDEQRKAKKAAAVAPAPAATQSDATESIETSVTNSAASISKDKERVKEKDKRGAKDLLKAIKVKEKLNSASKEKEKGGKSYREERMRRLEQREELRRKNSKTSDSSETTNQESNSKDKKTDDSSSHEPVEDKYKKQRVRTESYQKNRRKDYEKRTSEYHKSKGKDFQNDRSKKKLLIAQKPQDESNISENKENNSNCVKKDEAKEALEKQVVKKIGTGSQKDDRNSEVRPKESGAVPKRRKSLDAQSKPSNSVKKKKDDEKEDLKSVASNTLSKSRTENPSSEKSDSKKISKSETLARRNTTEDESATSPVATLERRKSLESQAAPTKSGESQTKKDPRSERRIRNKDRPALEIYRPGMGKFSKQRLEKVLGSSTERDTPSPSPSITSN